MNDDDDRWLEIAGLILDGKPVAWDTIPGDRVPDAVSVGALRVIADVADLHRAPAGEPVRRWGTLAIQEQIGHGTFGDVYRARDTALDRDVALKLVDPTPSASAPDEGRLLARLRHSNVVTVYGAAIHDGRYGIWMEFIRGRTLAAVVREHGPLAPDGVTAIGIDVCRALTAVHESGLLHGDVKPQNVMREDGGRIVVMDFGTGRVIKDGAADDRLAGTPLYLAPELLFGAAPDVRADVYGVGVLLYYLLTGAHPIEGSTLDEVRVAHASGVRTPLRSRRPDIPRPLASIVERAIAVEPSDRFERVADLERALCDSLPPPARSFSKRLMAVIAVGALLVGASAMFVSRQHLSRREDASPTPAPTHRQITFVGDAYFPAISRDGKFLAYFREPPDVLQRTVFVQDSRGGTPHPVFTGEGLGELVWSHDGSELLISTEGTTLIVPRVGGRARRVGPNLGRRSWSPNNTRFAGSAVGMNGIVFVDSRTGESTHIPLTGSFAGVGDVDWSPTGGLLLFETFDAPTRWATWTIRVDGSHQEKLYESSLPSSPRWAPKGDALYYFQNARPRDLLKLSVSDRTGKATGPPQVLMAGLQAGPVFTVSGDGQQLVYTREISRENLWLASTTHSSVTASVRQLTSGTTQDGRGSISPDGRRIAFTRFDVNKMNICVMPIDGDTPTQITFLNTVSSTPVWSPDGERIAFTSIDGGQNRIWVVNATGGTPRALDQTRDGLLYSWAPNGNIIYKKSNSETYLALNPTTGDQRPLFGDGYGADMTGAWPSPDASQLAVYRSRDPIGIWLIPFQRPSNGSPLTGGSFYPIGWSTSGKSIYAYMREHRTQIVIIRTDGGEIHPVIDVPLAWGTRLTGLPTITADGQRVVYSAVQSQSDVWIAQNFDSGR